MKKTIYILIIGVIIVLLPLYVHADCASERNEFKKVEDKYYITYEYNKETDSFDIIYYELNKSIFKTKINSNLEVDYRFNPNNNLATGKISNYKSSTFEYTIVSKSGACYENIKFETIKLYKYNQYADNELCIGNEEFILCDKDYEGKISEEEFKSRIETYIEDKNDKKDPTSNDSKSNKNSNKKDNSNFTDYIKENAILITLVGIFIVIIIATIIIMIIKSIKGRRLT